MTRVKVCGVTRVEDALAAARAGAAAIGMIFAPSARTVDIEVAAAICIALPAHVDRVGVFADQSADEIRRVATRVHLTRVQLHGNEEPELARDLPGAVTRALTGEGERLRAEMRRWREVRADAQFLLDLPKTPPVKDPQVAREQLWSVAAELAPEPLVLAGGLDPDNVSSALGRVRPAGVDVARGVEDRPGIKDHKKLERFLSAVAAFDEVHPPA